MATEEELALLSADEIKEDMAWEEARALRLADEIKGDIYGVWDVYLVVRRLRALEMYEGTKMLLAKTAGSRHIFVLIDAILNMPDLFGEKEIKAILQSILLADNPETYVGWHKLLKDPRTTYDTVVHVIAEAASNTLLLRRLVRELSFYVFAVALRRATVKLSDDKIDALIQEVLRTRDDASSMISRQLEVDSTLVPSLIRLGRPDLVPREFREWSDLRSAWVGATARGVLDRVTRDLKRLSVDSGDGVRGGGGWWWWGWWWR
jgi:hypothetical protein